MTPTRRMLIEDIELMIHARRRLLAHAARCEEGGESMPAPRASAALFLREDTRLEEPMFVEMEVDPDFDTAMREALEFEKDQLPKDPPPLEVQTEDVPAWFAARIEALDRVRQRLAE
jgi:hypothetical protein